MLEYISFTDTSKSNGAWFAIISSWLISNLLVNSFIKSITDLWHINTPLGIPVEPDVKLAYKGSTSNALLLIIDSVSSSIVVSKISSIFSIFKSAISFAKL